MRRKLPPYKLQFRAGIRYVSDGVGTPWHRTGYDDDDDVRNMILRSLETNGLFPTLRDARTTLRRLEKYTISGGNLDLPPYWLMRAPEGTAV